MAISAALCPFYFFAFSTRLALVQWSGAIALPSLLAQEVLQDRMGISVGSQKQFRSRLKIGQGARRMVAVLAVTLLAAGSADVVGSQAAQAATKPLALILGTSVTVPGPPPAAANESLEQYEAEKDGFTVTSVTGAQWDAMTAAQFARYRVLIIGDPTCDASGT